MNMTKYQVGERIPEFKRGDGVFLKIDDSGIMLLCVMKEPTAKEKRAFHSRQPLRIWMGEYSGLLYWTVKFGDIPMMDCTYSPQIEPKKPELEIPGDGQGYALTVILADGATGEIINIRLVGLPHDFSLALREILERVSEQPINHQLSIAALYSLSTQELADRATVQCFL